MADEVILKVEHLKKYFPVKGGFFSKTIGSVKAVDDISFEIRKGETLGIVGESGCGKSTTGRTVLQLIKPTEGKVYFKGQDITNLSKKELRKLRTKMQLIFQDPYASLNPRLTVGQIIGEALVSHGMVTKKEMRKAVLEIMRKCGLDEYQIDRFPHEFSGGQRQRIGIARALALNPEFIVADEPVSALDVSIQAQIINLLAKLQKENNYTYMFISHDLSVVEHLCTRVGVMYLGSMVELTEKNELFQNPLHPYTKALLSAVPIPDPTIKRKRIILKGEIPSPVNPPKGCRFNTRCPYSDEKCKCEVPEYREVLKNHFVACHKAEEINKLNDNNE